ncbi:HNH endonuclease signature motif containing protein [Demequina sp. NBRC 110055]|uniref:HNH endonuclease n=1 Tax=Demequina sp. NBRC 110055 TaxID=1570344 RepID=UPI0009FE515B|nr:HNH endonuclease signature motif containing protein [Demequina sp. NBRC 110055]
MTFSTAELDRTVAVARSFEGDDLGSTPANRLVELQSALVQVRRMTEVALGEVAGELARRSDPADGLQGVARKRGFTSPGQMLADALGGSEAEAQRILAVANATRPREVEPDESGVDAGGDGEGASAPAAAHFPVLADAVMSGAISMEAAAVITRALERIEQVAPDKIVAIEHKVVTKARTLNLRDIRRMLLAEEAWHRPRDVEERDRVAFENRYVQIKDEADGSVGIHARLDVSTAAPIVTLLKGAVKTVMRTRRDNALKKGKIGMDFTDDDRTPGQIHADALSAAARHSLGCTEVPTGVTTTIVLRATIDDVETGVGCASVDGIDSPISVGTLRRMAVDLEVLPMIMGGDSVPLDVGCKDRLFSAEIKLALVERDGGCSWCHAPPSYCEAHHIKWWKHGGPTDLSNGVLLCVSCHHRIHHGGWDIDIRGTEVWFIPPASIDPDRTPRIGGKAHYQLEQAT